MWLCCCCLYSAVLRSRAHSLRCCCMWFWKKCLSLFLKRVFEYPPKWCIYSATWLLHGWCRVKLLPSRRVPYTPYNHAPVYSVSSFQAKHVGCMSVCVCVCVFRCNQPLLHFFLCVNNQDLLSATAVTRRWNGYRNESQHRKLTLEKIIPPFQPGMQHAPFRLRIRCFNHWAICTLSRGPVLSVYYYWCR